MNLSNLYMAMMLVKIESKKLTASSAGIPPIFIYRKQLNTIEEFVIKGMPLGAFRSFHYKSIETDLNSGDVVLLMTDGLAELFNFEKKEFDFDRIKEVLLKNSHLSAAKIVQKLFQAGEKWQGDQMQNDDITLIVIRVK